MLSEYGGEIIHNRLGTAKFRVVMHTETIITTLKSKGSKKGVKNTRDKTTKVVSWR